MHPLPQIPDDDLKKLSTKELLLLVVVHLNWQSIVIGNHIEHHTKLYYVLLTAVLGLTAALIISKNNII